MRESLSSLKDVSDRGNFSDDSLKDQRSSVMCKLLLVTCCTCTCAYNTLAHDKLSCQCVYKPAETCIHKETHPYMRAYDVHIV